MNKRAMAAARVVTMRDKAEQAMKEQRAAARVSRLSEKKVKILMY